MNREGRKKIGGVGGYAEYPALNPTISQISEAREGLLLEIDSPVVESDSIAIEVQDGGCCIVLSIMLSTSAALNRCMSFNASADVLNVALALVLSKCS